MTKFHLNKHAGKFMGVCAGLADMTGIDVLWIRLAAVAITLLGSGIPILLYLVVAFLAEQRPIGD